jgi:hypothetical protein
VKLIYYTCLTPTKKSFARGSKVILIHEISHTRTRGFHGEEWITQMEKTADRADQLGEIELAQFIREEVDRYVMRNKIDRYKGIL